MGRLFQTLPNLSLARSGLDRHAERRLEPGLLQTLLADRATRVLELHGDKVAVSGGDGWRGDGGPVPHGASLGGDGAAEAGPVLTLRAPRGSDADRLLLYLGQDGEGPAYLAVVGPPVEDGDGTQLSTLRHVGADLSDRDATLFTTALALANWHATHTHCPRCGAATEPVQAGWLRRCTRDGTEHYPRTDVAVIMSVVDDRDRLLLARGAGWGEGRFSVLAGFLEPGESLAAAVAREVHEEVGLAVTEVEYLGDQPWPFPTSLMVGFTARAVGSDLMLQESEIAEARWFTREEYRELVASGVLGASTRLSIARRLVERWLGHGIDEIRAAGA